MEESDEFLENVGKEIDSMKMHVRDLISSFQKNEDLIKVQAPLISILKKDEMPEPQTVGKRGRRRISATQKKNGDEDQRQFYESQVQMTQDQPEKLAILTSTFTFEVEDSFLVYKAQVEKWVKGIIITNTAPIPQKLPLAVLVPRFTTHTNFNFIVNFIPIENDGKLTNLRKKFKPQLENPDKEISQFVQPDEKIMIIITFSHPGVLNWKRVEEETELLLTLVSELNEQWSYSIEISILNALNPMTEEKEKSEFVVRGISSIEESFNLSTTLHEDLGNLLESFLYKSNFKLVNSKSPSFDSSCDSFASLHNFGLLFQLEKCSNDLKSIDCQVTARSKSQMKIFASVFLNWVKEHNLRISNFPPQSSSQFLSTLQEEIQILTDLVHLNHNGFLGGGEKKGDLNWLLLYVKALQSTDLLLIQNH